MIHAGRSRVRGVRRLALAGALSAVLALVGSVLVAAPASAHASLLTTDPSEGQVLASTPDKATFTFDEPVRSQSGGVHLFDARGDQLDATSKTTDDRLVVDLPGTLADGTYVVAWRVISSDGHPVAGALTFSVGTPSTTVAAAAAVPQTSPVVVRAALGVVQALTYLGVFGACGLVVFLLLLLPRESGLSKLREQLGRLAARCALLTLAAGALLLPLTSLYQRADGLGALGSSEPWVDSFSGVETVSSVLLAAGTAMAVAFARRDQPLRSDRVIALGSVLLTLASLSLVGHTRSVLPFAVMVAADLSHVAAGSVWFGGLIGLVISLRRLTERPRIGALVLGRFSALAAWLLVLVAVSGSVLAWRILQTWSNLVDTNFGRVLLVKIAVVALVAAIAGWNRYRVMPAVLSETGFADRAVASSRLQRTVRVEAVLLVGVLGLTGFLVDRSPVPDTGAIALPGGFDSSTFSGQTGSVKVVAVVQPATVGRNEILLQLQDVAGDPIEPVATPTLNARDGDLALGEQEVTNVDSGTYRAQVVLPRAGTWTLQVSVRLTEFENPVVAVAVPVRAPGPAAP